MEWLLLNLYNPEFCCVSCKIPKLKKCTQHKTKYSVCHIEKCNCLEYLEMRLIYYEYCKLTYTCPKKKLVAFSFANFEMARWSTGKSYVPWKMHNYLMIKLNYTDQKKLLPDFLKFKLKKRGVSFLGECI